MPVFRPAWFRSRFAAAIALAIAGGAMTCTAQAATQQELEAQLQAVAQQLEVLKTEMAKCRA